MNLYYYRIKNIAFIYSVIKIFGIFNHEFILKTIIGIENQNVVVLTHP